MANTKSVLLKIKRQNTPTSKPYWEEFELAWHPGMNVISSLMEIAANPVTREARRPRRSLTIRIVWKKSAAPAPCLSTDAPAWPAPP